MFQKVTLVAACKKTGCPWKEKRVKVKRPVGKKKNNPNPSSFPPAFSLSLYLIPPFLFPPAPRQQLGWCFWHVTLLPRTFHWLPWKSQNYSSWLSAACLYYIIAFPPPKPSNPCICCPFSLDVPYIAPQSHLYLAYSCSPAGLSLNIPSSRRTKFCLWFRTLSLLYGSIGPMAPCRIVGAVTAMFIMFTSVTLAPAESWRTGNVQKYLLNERKNKAIGKR